MLSTLKMTKGLEPQASLVLMRGCSLDQFPQIKQVLQTLERHQQSIQLDNGCSEDHYNHHVYIIRGTFRVHI
jgi:hypothetical protein